MAELWTPTEASEKGIDVYYNNSTGGTAYLVALLEEYEPGNARAKIGGKTEVSPTQVGHATIQINKGLNPNGGIFRVGLSKAADSVENIRFLGNAPLIKFMAPGDVELVDTPVTSVTRANDGGRVWYQAPSDRDVWIYAQVKRTTFGWGIFGSYRKVAAGSSGSVLVPIIKSWHREGGVFRVCLSDSVNMPGSVKPIGNTPIRTIMKNDDSVQRYSDDADSIVKSFVVGRSYSPSDYVTYKDEIYICISTHKSQSDWTPDIAVSLWIKLDPKGSALPN